MEHGKSQPEPLTNSPPTAVDKNGNVDTSIVPTIEVAKQAFETKWENASDPVKGAMKFMLVHAFPVFSPRTKDMKLFRAARGCYLKFLGKPEFCYVVATMLMCVSHYSCLDNIIHNASGATHRKKRQRVLRKGTEEKIAKTYYRLLTWIRNLVKDDNEFPNRLREWQKKTFVGSTRELKESDGSSGRTETCPKEHRQVAHTCDESDPELEIFQKEQDFDFFAANPLGLPTTLDSSAAYNIAGV